MAMKWSKQLPKLPGYYWHKGEWTQGRPMIAQVVRNKDGHLVAGVGLDPVKAFGGGWAGPLTPPS